MKVITKNFYKSVDFNSYFNNKDVCFIDIETTGLSRVYNSIYLIGVLYFQKENDKWTLTQFFGESIEDEKSILLEFVKFISVFDQIITYNGDAFDIPFINHRLEKQNISYEILKKGSFDLYKLVRENKSYLNLDNLKLKTLELYLGINRDDIYSGKDCISFFIQYTKTRAIDLEAKLLQHNFDDLYYMLDTIRIIDYIKEKKLISINHIKSCISLLIDNIKIVGDLFIIAGTVNSNEQIRLIQYADNYKLEFNNENKFEISLEYSIGMVSPTQKGIYLDKNKIALSDQVTDSTKYELPLNVLLLMVEKEYFMDNIKSIVRDLVTQALDL